MAKPLLSICIPNYNRPEKLAANLDAIAREHQKDIEIVIVDDCSPDPVDKVILSFKEAHPEINLRFYKNKPNLGFDRNVLKVLSLAEGKFGWLLSNDDQVLPNSIKYLTCLIKNDPTLAAIIINYQRYDHILKEMTSDKMINIDNDLRFESANSFFFHPIKNSYFKFLGSNTLTMSIDIVNLEYWNEVADNLNQYIGHNFIHVFGLVALISKHPNIIFVAKPQVQYLSNNHRIWPNRIWKDYNKYLLDYMLVLGYDRKDVLNLRTMQKADEINEEMLVTLQSRPMLFRMIFPLMRKVRLLLGHKV